MKRIHKITYYSLLLLAFLLGESTVGYGQNKEKAKVEFKEVTEEGESNQLKIIHHRNGIDPEAEGVEDFIKNLLGENFDDDETSLTNSIESIKKISSGEKTKWHGKRGVGDYGDTFNNDQYYFDPKSTASIQVHNISQAAHTYIDSMYYVPGEEVDLYLPTILLRTNTKLSTSSKYVRWYNYSNGTVDFATDTELYFYVDGEFQGENKPFYKYSNGYVSIVNDNGDAGGYDSKLNQLLKATYKSKNEGWDLIACNISSYNDALDKDGEKTTDGSKIAIEPTLTNRVIFYLKSVYAENGLVNMLKGLGENQYLKEFTIHFPTVEQAKKIGNDAQYSTRNNISLSMQAQNYCLKEVAPDKFEKGTSIIAKLSGTAVKKGLKISPFACNSTDEKLRLTYGGTGTVVNSTDGDEEGGIEICLGGRCSNIFLIYPESRLEDGDDAIITVTNEAGHRIAKYTIIFDENTQGLTETALKQIKEMKKEVNSGVEISINGKCPEITTLFQGIEMDKNKKEELLDQLYSRTDEYMQKTYGEPYVRLNWDYQVAQPNKGKGESASRDLNYYPYPMNWDYSTYGFMDGDFDNILGSRKFPQWGQYAIIDGYVFTRDIATTWTDDSSLELPEDYKNYHLYVDASDQPGVVAKLPLRRKLCKNTRLFITAWMKSGGYEPASHDAGITLSFKGVKADGTETYLHRYSSGQIRKSNSNGLSQSLTGGKNNEWFQLYTSFTNTDDSEDYESYLVQIENNGANTSGTDFYLDDICVYIDELSVEAKQANAPCGGQIDIDIEIDKEKLKNRISDFEDENLVVYYSFINKKVYDEAYNNKKNAAEAFAQAVIHGNGVYQHHNEEHRPGGNECFFGSFSVGQDGVTIDDDKITFCSNILPVYNTPQIGDEDNELHYMVAGEEYYIVVMAYSKENIENLFTSDSNDNPFISPESGKEDVAAAYDLAGDCKIIGKFKVREPDIKIIYGDAKSSPAQFCLGQEAPINVTISDETLAVLKENGANLNELAVDYFWSNSEDDYKIMCEDDTWRVIAKLREKKQGVIDNIDEALNELDFSENEKPVELNKIQNIIKKCVKNGTLFLTATSSKVDNKAPVVSLNPILSEATMYYVVFPIEQNIQTDKKQSSKFQICWQSIPGVVTATEAPKLNTGFQQVDYPEDDYNPAIRIGLEGLGAVKNDKVLRIPLRNPRKGAVNSASLELLKDNKVYLVGTGDPKKGLQVAVGEVKTLVAEKGKTDNSNYMDIVFYDTFEPYEGYTYNLNFQFQLKEDASITDASATGTCTIGSLTFPMHIVPKYQKWIGGKTDNWNDDSKWERSTVIELRKDEQNSDGYKDYGGELKPQGFVPMSFTYVTIPTETPQVELYAPGISKSDKDDKPAILDLTKEDFASSTTHIEYDLMADATEAVGGSPTDDNKVAYYCRPYYTNTVNEIHFEPNTEMLHTELLTYNKAWIDYDLAPNRWYTLASPLKAVVAGDWYVPSKDYRQETEYFQPITFNREKDINNRFNPAVYQRSWDKGGVTRYETNALRTPNLPSTVSTIAGDWSIVYNDVTVPYDLGQGFSIKTVATTGNNGNVLFRLPKDDTSYKYYSVEGDEQGSEVLVRGDGIKTGQFLLDKKAGNNTYSVTIKNEKDNNPYFLVGNPFMAHLDMTKFFNQNGSSLDGNKFWIVDNDQQFVSVKDADVWTSTKVQTLATVAPLQSFFVKKKTETNRNGSNELELTFTNDMQVLGEETDNLLRSTSSTPRLQLTTSKGGKQSKALIVCKASADDAFQNNEDAELFLDSNLGDVPIVYTVAGNQTASINVRKSLTNIPLGVFAPDNGEVEVTISGQESFGNFELYDAENNHSQLIGNGEVSVMLKGNTHGRYFLRSDYVPTANEKVTAQKQIIIYSAGNGQIVVSSVDPLTQVFVYDLSGKLVTGLTNLHTPTAHVQGLNPGQLYIVRAETANQVQSEKVEVR